MKQANQRKVFGKRLIEQPVIRNKLAAAVASLEALQTYSESITYSMCNLKEGPLGTTLAGPIVCYLWDAAFRLFQPHLDICGRFFGGLPGDLRA